MNKNKDETNFLIGMWNSVRILEQEQLKAIKIKKNKQKKIIRWARRVIVVLVVLFSISVVITQINIVSLLITQIVLMLICSILDVKYEGEQNVRT